ncbi:MAG: hypothetical protein RRB22_14340 [Gammaproteobacteria bacterium]|nr:hypothetical protein [Gammaproteobacteria bacterium]
MEQLEIAVREWTSFCDEFSLAHRGWLVTLAMMATTELQKTPEALAAHWRVIADDLHFNEIAIGPMPGTCIISAKPETQTAIFEHRLKGIVRLFRLTTNRGHQGMRIDTVDGGDAQSTFIWFRTPALPEQLDGLAISEL